MDKRRSIHLGEYGHTNPIPAASVYRGMLASSLITGRSRQPDDNNSLDAQCTRMFQRIEAVLQEAGGTPDDILKISIYLKNTDDRSALNRAWIDMFPDDSSRPARQVLPMILRSDALISCEILAVVDK